MPRFFKNKQSCKFLLCNYCFSVALSKDQQKNLFPLVSDSHAASLAWLKLQKFSDSLLLFTS